MYTIIRHTMSWPQRLAVYSTIYVPCRDDWVRYVVCSLGGRLGFVFSRDSLDILREPWQLAYQRPTGTCSQSVSFQIHGESKISVVKQLVVKTSRGITREKKPT